jgi:hypothetical protein
MLVLGIAGTAKNTGKTTTTVSIVNQWAAPEALAVTSIGYDGESKDNVTGLPKPRLNLPAGVLVVTAERCLEAGSARIETLERTEVPTPLGKLVVGRVRKSGLVVLAGPNNESALKQFIQRIKPLGISLLLVDGALGRIAPMSATDGLILATGAARTRDMDRLARETAAFSFLLSLPGVDDLAAPVLNLGSLLVEKQGLQVAKEAAGYRTLEFTGVVDIKPLTILLTELGEHSPDLIIKDPIKLLLAQDPAETAQVLAAHIERGARVLVRNALPLRVITVNPFYPDYNEANRQYSPGHLDAQLVFDTIAGIVDVPVVDVVRQGGIELGRVLGLPGK